MNVKPMTAAADLMIYRAVEKGEGEDVQVLSVLQR
jgi:hypothetical protein